MKGKHLYQKVHTGPFATAYVNLLAKKWPALILLVLWISLAVMGLLKKQEFTNNGALNINAPKNTDAYNANSFLKKHFDAGSGQNDIITCMVRSTNKSSVVENDDAKRLSDHYIDFVQKYNDTDANEGERGHIDSLMTYWHLSDDLGLGSLAGDALLNDPKNPTAMLFTSRWTNTNVFIDKRTHDLISYYESAAGKPEKNLEIYCISKDSVLGEVLDDVIETLDFMDKVAPIGILFFLLLVLKSLALTTIPIATVACSLGTSILVCNAVAKSWGFQYVSAAPAVISSFCFAFSADFTLFILARFKNALFAIGSEEQDDSERHSDLLRGDGVDTPLGDVTTSSDDEAKNGESPEERQKRRTRDFHHSRGIASTVYAMTTAGRNVIFSGMTVLLSVCTLMLIPVQFMRTLGFFLAIAISVTIICNVTLTPALLVLIPNFYQLGLRTAVRKAHEGAKPIGERVFSFVSKAPLSLPGSIIIILVTGGLLAFFGPDAIHIKHSLSYSQAIPKESAMMDTIKVFQKEFTASTVEPIQIMVHSKETLWSEEAFNGLQDFQEKLIPTLKFHGKPIDSQMLNTFVMAVNPFTQQFGRTPFASAQMFYNINKAYKFQVDMQTRSVDQVDRNAAVFLFRPPVDSFAQDHEVETFYQALRALVERAEREKLGGKHVKWYVSHSMMDSIDGINSTYSDVGLICGLIVAFVFLIAAAAFKSIVAPFRTVVCVGTTWMIVIGFCAKYSKEMLDIDRYFWLTPIFASVLCISIACDYDTFLSVAVHNLLREDQGLTARDAIKRAMETSTSVILAAGMIMASAFWTLILGSSTALVKQFGICLTATVIVDTMFVRTFLQPALMFLLGRAHYWPFGLKKGQGEKGGKYAAVDES